MFRAQPSPAKLLALLLLLTGLNLPAPARPGLTLAHLKDRAARLQLESPQSYLASAQASQAIFLRQGGAVKIPSQWPTLILPDLHAQRDYLMAALELKVEGGTIWSLLQKGRVNLLLLGDGMHAENRAEARWRQAEADFRAGRDSSALQAELVESLGLLQMIMDLKVHFPANFFFIRGNHEDINPAQAYGKFTQLGESNLVKAWLLRHWGQSFLESWHDCEHSMPLLAEGSSFVATHSPPERPITRAEVNSRNYQTFRTCTWSDNTRWSPGGAQELAFLENCRTWQVSPQRPWISGHRKVKDAAYRSQCQGHLIQINPLDFQARVYIWAPAQGRTLVPQLHVRKLI